MLAAWPQSLLPHSSPTPEKLLTIPPVNKCPKCLLEPVLVLQQGKYFYDMFLAFTFKVKTSRAPLTLCCVVIVFVNHVINLYWGLLIWSLHVHLKATTGALLSGSSSGTKKNELKFAFLGAYKWNNKTFSYCNVHSSGPHSYMMYQSEFHHYNYHLWHPFDKMYWPQSMAGWM